jgi:hypothetical protein
MQALGTLVKPMADHKGLIEVVISPYSPFTMPEFRSVAKCLVSCV